MPPVITPEESKRLDAESTVALDVLMERAGYAVAIAAARMGIGYGNRVAVLAGTGMNGGDGYVAARHLVRRGAAVTVHSLGFPKGEVSASRKAAALAVHHGVDVVPLASSHPGDVDLVIDALFGTGFHGSLPDSVRAWSRTDAAVLSVDIPSGLDGLTGIAAPGTFCADVTVTFGAAKVGHLIGDGPDVSGSLEVVDIGLPEPDPSMYRVDGDDIVLPMRSRTAHKWSVGSVAVVGGARGIAGAPVLAALSALRSGAGAVTVVGPSELEVGQMDLLSAPVGKGDRLTDAAADEVLDALERFDVAVVGPGLGMNAAGLVEAVVTRYQGALVLDADALQPEVLDSIAAREAPTVLTPHSGEFERMSGEIASWETARELAEALGCIVLLKGNPSVVVGDRVSFVTNGTARLATIGTGDVLAGCIAALIARGLDAESATWTAAWCHGEAAERLQGTLTASRLVESLGRVV